MGWYDPNSKNYNKLIRLPSVYKYEKLHKKEMSMYIIVLNYNMNHVVKIKVVQSLFILQKIIKKQKDV